MKCSVLILSPQLLEPSKREVERLYSLKTIKEPEDAYRQVLICCRGFEDDCNWDRMTYKASLLHLVEVMSDWPNKRHASTSLSEIFKDDAQFISRKAKSKIITSEAFSSTRRSQQVKREWEYVATTRDDSNGDRNYGIHSFFHARKLQYQ